MNETSGLQKLIDVVTELCKRVDSLEAMGGKGGNNTVWEMTQIMAAKERAAKEIRNSHCAEVAMGDRWDSPENKARWIKLRSEIKHLNNRIAGI